MPPLQINASLTRKQIEFVTATQRYCLSSGGWGSGKTTSLGYKLLTRATRKGAREILCRKTNVSLSKSTLKTLLEGDGEKPPIFPEGTYEHLKQSQVIKFKNGGEVIYFGLDDPQRLGSINATGAAVDELVELTRRDFDWLDSRVRVNVPGMSNQVYGACNPGPPTHWAAELWGLALAAKAQPDTFHVRTRMTDNPFLPAKYVEAQRSRLTGVRLKRFFDGIWAGADGLVLDQWDRDTHCRPTAGPYRRAIIGLDEGYSDPFVALLVLIDGDSRMHVAEEIHSPGLHRDEKIRLIRGMMNGSPIPVETVIADPSAAELIDDMRRANLPVQGADNTRDSGIEKMRVRLIVAGDGKPRLTVSPNCPMLMQDIETWEYKPLKAGSDQRKDEPSHDSSHGPDALRYATAYLDAGIGDFHLIGANPNPATPAVVEGYSINFSELRKDHSFGFE